MIRKMSKKILVFLLTLTIITSSFEVPVIAAEMETEVNIETTSVEESTVEETTIETTPVEESTIEDDSIEEISAEESSTEEISSEETSVEESSTEEISSEETSTEKNTTEEIWDGKTTESIYEADNYTVTFQLIGSWNGGYNANIRIDNTSDTVIENWKIQIDYKGNISNIWNAVIEKNEEGRYIIKNAGWNQDIAVGSYVEFGFSGQEDFKGFPTAYKMLGTKTITKKEDYTIEYKIQNDWGVGFSGLITITNNTEKAIEDWILEFDGENDITDIWNGIIESREELHYVVKNAGYNQNIAPKSSVSVGFNVSNGDSAKEFTNFVLSKYNDDEEIDAPVRDKEPLESIGEAYYKQPSKDDIIVDEESGIQYIKNQLLISAYMGAEKAIFEEIAAEVGAKIVGYIELTNDYQIEFTENKTLAEMEMIADYIDSYSFVSTVTLNFYEAVDSAMSPSNDTLYNDEQTCNTIMVDTDDGEDKKPQTNFVSIKDTWDEDDPSGDNWGLEALRVPSAWDYEDTFSTVKVGIYDQGFGKHEDLIFDDIVNNTDDVNYQGHGTHVAGTIAAQHNNKKGISGVATDIRLYAYATTGTDYGSTMGDKIAYATLIGNHVKVINVSLQFDSVRQYAASHGNENAQRSIQKSADALEEYLNKLVTAGYDFVICVAAGNTDNVYFVVDNTETYGYRNATEDEINDSDITKVKGNVYAKYGYNLTAIDDENLKKRIIVVGAMENKGERSYSKASFSNYGDRIDFMAPGVNILSTVPTGIDATGYQLKSGTSMACPHIAGLAAMMYQINPALKASNIKLYMSLSSKDSLTYGSKTYKIPDAVGCCDFAKNALKYDDNDNTWPSGIVCGYTKDISKNALSGVKVTAVRKSTGEYNLGQYSFSFESDSNGYYMKTLPQGTYDFIVSKDGYLPYAIKDVAVNPDETTYMETVVLPQWIYPESDNSAVQGIVKDALKGTVVDRAVVKLRKGWNNKEGEYCKLLTGSVRSAITMADGTFSIKIGNGTYTAEITKNGYVTAYYNVIATNKGDQIAMVLTPVLSEDEYRIVLTWGDSPSDLDSHLTYYVGEEQMCHVYFGSKIGNYDGKTIAKLDLDDTSSYGPETVTVTLDAGLMENGGEFRYSVHNYSGQGSLTSKALSLSNATIHVYAGNNLINTFFVPKDQVGTVWHVFDITEKGIKAVNEFYNSASAAGVQ